MYPTQTLTLRLLLVALVGVGVALLQPTHAQLQLPVASPYGTVTETIGISDVTVTYGRPAVNGRQIWGSIVPYGEAPFPWRAGANENTTVSFEHDMLIEGRPLAAGTYGLHMAPSQGDWTIIFSHNATSWGSFSYQQSEDALRVTVTPEQGEHRERLTYEFDDHQGVDQAALVMHWERMRVPIQLQVANQHGVVLAQAQLDLRNRPGFSWQGWAQAANYALQNNVQQEQAVQWADQALNRNRNFNTLALKAQLLQQTGDADGGKALMDEAIPLSNENQLNAYGYQLMGAGQTEDALRIFTLNVERFPDSWNPHDSLAECYAGMGDTRNARKFYQMALDKLPANDGANKQRIESVLAGLD